MVHQKCMLVWVERGVWRGVCVCVCVFILESGSLQITSHPFNMVLLPSELLSVFDRGNGMCKQLTSASQKHTLTLRVHHSKWGGSDAHLALTTMAHQKCMLIWVKGGECVWGEGVSVCMCSLWNKALCKSCVIPLTW